MSDFLRPAARATLWRWRDVIGAVIVILLGLWWLGVAHGAVRWLGYVTILSEALFDAFASLPGIRTQKLLDALERTPDARIVIWQRSAHLLH